MAAIIEDNSLKKITSLELNSLLKEKKHDTKILISSFEFDFEISWEGLLKILQIKRERKVLETVINEGSYVTVQKITIHNCKFLRESEIRSSSIKLEFNNCKFYKQSNGIGGGLPITTVNLDKNIIFISCAFYSEVQITIISHEFCAKEFEFLKSVTLINSTPTIQINNLKAYDNLRLNHNGKEAIILNSSCKELACNFYCDNAVLKLHQISIESLKVGDNFKYSLLKVENSNILTFNLPHKRFHLIDIEGGKILNFRLENSVLQNAIKVKNVEIQNLSLVNFNNAGAIDFQKIISKENDQIKLDTSDLGKANLFDCDFSLAKLSFINSKVLDIFLFNSTFVPKNTKGIDNSQLQLLFGQLSLAFQKSGNTVMSLEYASRELYAYKKSINLLSNSFFTKINLYLNFISTNFGRNWFLGIVSSIAFGILAFTILLISTSDFEFAFPSFDWSLTPAYTRFINPLRSFDLESLFKSTPFDGSIRLNPCTYIVDFCARIFLAYFYYQTIQSFRRLGRK